MLKKRLLKECVLLPALIISLCACTNTNRLSYKQIDLTDEQVAEALAKAPASFKDSTITIAAGPSYKKNAFHRWVWGSRNRDLWATPVTFEVLDLATERGGLKPVKRGGGMQTKSLRLTDKDGHEYDLRSINKEPSTALPKILRKTFIAGMARDQTAAMHPYGPLVVPKLAKAAGLFYLQPKYVFVPYDPRLGEFAKEYGGMIALLEPHPDENHPEMKHFGKIDKLDDSQELLEERFASQDVTIDQRMFAKARLFDMWVGDWDRHQGQWTWAGFKVNGKMVYKPIAEDRDQIFYRLSDGWLSWLLTQIGPLRKLETFGDNEINVQNYAYNARFIDKRMLYRLTREDWAEIADSLQISLTDAAIADAIKELPEPIYSNTSKELYAALRSRRSQLPEVASKYFKLLAREVEIPGTDQKEKFVVTRKNNSETLVEVFSLEDEKEEKLIYSRLFYRKHTKEINLFGLRDEDIFELSGEVKKGVIINIIGGMGEDKVVDRSKVSGWGKKTRVYDTRYGMEIEGSEAKDKTRRNVKINAYDEEGL